MTDNVTPTEDTGQTTPATPLDPATAAMTVIPPIVPLSTWTWNSPVIPSFYWNVYSAEQRVRQICMEIGRIEAYLDYFGAYANRAHGELNKRIDTLTAKLTEEVNRLDKRIDEENKAREEADALLQKGLDAETARAKAAEKVLQSNVDTVQSNLDAEAATRKQADDKLTTDLANETARAKNAEQENATNIANETTARKQEDTKLGNRITDETTDRENADTALGNRVDAVDARVTQETTDRTQADTRLEGKIDANAANITANADAIAKETARAKTAEAANTSMINANKTAADEADKRIQDSLDTETANRKNGDNALAESLATESKKRADADTALGGRIDTEADTRAKADTDLGIKVNKRVIPTNVKAKEGSHITVDTTVSDTDPNGTTITLGDTFDADFTALTTKVTDLEGRLTHETSDRESADNTLTEAVNKRLTADKVLAGANITVTPDPDKTTVTIAASVPDVSGKLDKVSHDDTLKGSGTTGDPLKANLKYDAAQTGTNVAYVRKDDNGMLGIKAGDGLTASNSEDPDQGSAIRLSDHIIQLVEGSEGALKSVSHDATLSGKGTADDPLKVVGGGSGSGGLESVATNSTLTGNGTADSPLGVKLADGRNAYGVDVLPNDLDNLSVAFAGNDAVNHTLVGGAVKLRNDSNAVPNTIYAVNTTGEIGVSAASESRAGVVKPDGTTVTVDNDGTIHAAGGLGKVTVDGTLTGDGTSGKPLGVSETIVANSTAGSTALQTVHTDSTLTGDGTENNPLKVVSAGGLSTVSVKDNSGILGDGTSEHPLYLYVEGGNQGGLRVNDSGALNMVNPLRFVSITYKITASDTISGGIWNAMNAYTLSCEDEMPHAIALQVKIPSLDSNVILINNDDAKNITMVSNVSNYTVGTTASATVVYAYYN